MTDKKKATPKGSTNKIPKKIIALKALMRRSLVQLEALSLYGETCLHSTISDLYNNHGIEFKRVREPHQHQGGGIAHFARYTLLESSRDKAQALVNHYEARAAGVGNGV